MTAPALPALTEKQWQRQVVHLAQLHGWWCRHDRLPMWSQSGWPDLTLCRPPRLVLAELKTDRGKLTAAQQEVLDMLAQVPGIEVFCWRPADFAEVERVLRRER